ncbi:MAG: LacI family DNA-binding transcriptional regulator [Bauldia sp.]|nr:LacI family DNA-binding transcriptional regulator [Bauldia sp.]
MARDAAVSQSAVSRAFAGGSGVSAETRERILATAKRLGYQPNALARGLITRRSGIVGIVIADLANPFLSGALEKLSRKLKAAGLTPFLITADNAREVGEAIPALEQYRVDGCFVICSHLSRDVARKYRDLGSAVLLFNRSVPGLGGAAVSIDDVAAGRAVADLLADAGHRHIAFLHGMRGASTDRDRYEGFAARLRERGLPPPVRAWGGYTYAGGARSIHALMAERPRPSAVFCANDIMAMGAMDAARHDLGLRIPEDLSVVGFDDAPPAAWPSYDLTTVRQPVDAMIDAGIEMLGSGDGTPVSGRRVVPGELVVRSSTLRRKD